MYFVTLIGTNYSIAIKTGIIGAIGETVRFRSFLQECKSTAVYPVNCDVDITYDWQDDTPGSGTSTVTLISGSSQVVDTPTGYSLTGIQITNISGPLCDYSNFFDCTGDPFTPTTTTTTTTSTTTTTTTAASTGNQFLLKFDPYSSSYNPANGFLDNLGTINAYDLQSNNVSGIGYVQITGSGVSQALVLNQNVGYDHQTLDDNGELTSLINLYNKSYWLGVVIRINKWVDSYPGQTAADKEGGIFEMLGRKDNSSGRLNGIRLVAHANPTSSLTGTIRGYTIRNSRKILESQVGNVILGDWYFIVYKVARYPSGLGEAFSTIDAYNFSVPGPVLVGSRTGRIGADTAGEMDYQVVDQIGTPNLPEYSAFHIGALLFTTASSGVAFEGPEYVSVFDEYNSRF
jgi:hypothetical protein